MQNIERKRPSELSVCNIEFTKWSDKNTAMFLPGIWNIDVDIQTITDESLKIMFKDKFLTSLKIPWLNQIVLEEERGEYFKSIKKEVESRLFGNSKFAIISWPTWTWKTTLVNTIAHNHGLEVYSNIWDPEKSLSDFSEEVKSSIKWNVTQIKTIPWDLLKAMTSWGIFLINEANFLSSDLLIWLANLIENSFFIFDWKKYLIHKNFALVYTSNEWYAWTKEYSNATIRKAWWIVHLDHEPDKKREIELVKNIYKNIRNNLSQKYKNLGEIKDKDLELIANSIIKIRNQLKEEDFYTDDWATFSDHFYIRAYEKIISHIIIWKEWWFLWDIILEYNTTISSRIQYKDAFGWYIEFENDVHAFEKIIKKHTGSINIELKETNNWNELKFPDLLGGLLSKNTNVNNNEWTQKDKIKPKPLTYNLSKFRETVVNQVHSKWLELKREENIEKRAEEFYESILGTRNQKDITIIWKEGNYLKIELNWEEIILWTDNENEINKLINFTDKKELRKYLNDNNDIFILYEDEEYGEYIHNNKEYSKIKNIFSELKNLYIRKRSKLIKVERWWKKYVILLWFKWSIKDIRYEDDNGVFYIPQSKVNDTIFTIYEEKDEIDKAKWHTLTINKDSKLDFKSLSSLENWEQTLDKSEVFLDKLSKSSEIFKELEVDIKSRFRNADKLNLKNGWKEQYEAGVISPVLESVDVQDRVYDILWRKINFLTKTTEKLINDIFISISAGYDILLEWLSGVWKTWIVKEIADRKKLPYISLQIDEDFSESDIKWEIKWNEWMIENHLKPFLNMYKYWWIVELKELNYAIISAFLNEYMDKWGAIHFDGKIIERNPNFLIIATVNPANQILFPWTKAINTSSKSRVKEFKVLYLPKDEVKEIALSYLNSNKKLKEDFPDFEQILDKILSDIIIPILNNIEVLLSTQDASTDEELLRMSKKMMSIDILENYIKTSENRNIFIQRIKDFFYFDTKQEIWEESKINKEIKTLK